MHPFADHFSTIARAYAAARPSYPDALFAHLASLAPARRRAWDCAAGNGQATRQLARFFAEVVGTDASAAQIDTRPEQSRFFDDAMILFDRSVCGKGPGILI